MYGSAAEVNMYVILIKKSACKVCLIRNQIEKV